MAERTKTETDLETKARVPLSRERILATAEELGYGDNEFTPWVIGATM